MDNNFKANVLKILELDYQKTIKEANTVELYNAVSKAAMNNLGKDWGLNVPGKKVCYLSAEFLVGRLGWLKMPIMLWLQSACDPKCKPFPGK
jgi:starch phosphorylase